MEKDYSGFVAKFKTLFFTKDETLPTFFNQIFLENTGTARVMIEVSGLEIVLNEGDKLTLPNSLNPLIQIQNDMNITFHEDGEKRLQGHLTRLQPSIITY